LNLLFAWRYFKSKKSTNAINIIAWISVLAIVVGTASLIVLLSVFNGFEDLVKSLYASFYTDIKISPKRGKTLILTHAQLQKIKSVSGVKDYSLVAEEKALIQNGDLQTIVYMKGVDDRYEKVTEVASHVKRGSFKTGTADAPLAVLGIGIENALQVESDKAILPLTVYLPKKGVPVSEGSVKSIGNTDPLQSLSTDNVHTSGAFIIQQDFDNKYIITNLDFLKRMLNLQADEYGAAEIILNNSNDDDKVKQQLKLLLGENYVVQTRYEQNKSLYSIMQVEKWVIYAILSLILVVAAFTMIGALTMLVLEKQKDIQLLKAIGSDNKRIQSIFLNEGILLAGIGGILGVLLAVLICWLQVKYKLIALQGGTFVIDHYPVKISAIDILLVLCTVMIVALIASWFPARKAALQPIELKT